MTTANHDFRKHPQKTRIVKDLHFGKFGKNTEPYMYWTKGVLVPNGTQKNSDAYASELFGERRHAVYKRPAAIRR